MSESFNEYWRVKCEERINDDTGNTVAMLKDKLADLFNSGIEIYHVLDKENQISIESFNECPYLYVNEYLINHLIAVTGKKYINLKKMTN